jgi:hypothetical protein
MQYNEKESHGEKQNRLDNGRPMDLLQFFHGISQTQFWYQEISNGGHLFYRFIRYNLILAEIPLQLSGKGNPNDDLIRITGFSIQEFSSLMLALYAFLTQTSSEISRLQVDNETIKKHPILTNDNLMKCVEYFAADYVYYRKDNHVGNPLFFKPIVKTKTGRIICSNMFLMARKFYEGIYWIIRDDYFQKNSQEFTNNFGYYYEKYIENFLSYYLPKDAFRKLEEKGADWEILTDKYVLLVEQKSCVMSISLKREYPSIDGIETDLPPKKWTRS